jgi:carbonic anhydrase/acetyltransferase-like protein (isoleucine patch superfamily)
MIISHRGRTPQIAPGVFLAPTAVIIGDVEIGAEASIWFGAVLRGDHGRIVIGRGSNVQDNVTVHAPHDGQTVLEENVTVGHGAVLEGCIVRRGALIGINAVVLHGAEIGEAALVAAGCVVPEGMRVPPATLAAGVPARIKKQIKGSSSNWVEMAALAYRRLAREYMENA